MDKNHENARKSAMLMTQGMAEGSIAMKKMIRETWRNSKMISGNMDCKRISAMIKHNSTGSQLNEEDIKHNVGSSIL